MERGIEITWASLWRILGMLILISVLYVARDIWIAVFLAIVISSALDPIVTWLEKKGVHRAVGGLGVFLIVILTVALLLYTVVPIALSELNVFLKHLKKVDATAFGVSELSGIITNLSESIGKLANVLLSGTAPFIDIVSRFIGGLAITGAVFVISFYLTVDRDGVENFLRDIVPAAYEEKVLDIYFKTRRKIGKWLFGQLFLSLSVGVGAFVGLWIIGVKYSLVLGILAGVLELVPFVGPILSGSLAVLIAFSESWTSALYVFLLFLLIHEVETNLLTPVFMRLAIALHPAAILISILVGAKIFGFIGLVLAVPMAVLVQELMDSWSSEKNKRRAVTLPM